MSNYLATRKILRDKKKKPELPIPTPSALETASICHECPFALVSNVGPNTNMNCRPRDRPSWTQHIPVAGTSEGEGPILPQLSTSHPSRNAVYSIKKMLTFTTQSLLSPTVMK